MQKNITRSIGISLLVIALMFFNLTRIVNSDCLRAIHYVTLMVAGAAVYVLIVNILALLKGKN